MSATHSIIGGIVGFAFTWGGAGAVFWAEPDSTKIPPIKGVVPIILTWFIAPVLTGVASAIIYGITRFFVLTAQNSTERSYYVLPIMTFFTIVIDIYFTFTKGAKKQFQQNADDWDDTKALWVSVVIAAGLSIMSGIFGIPWLKAKLRAKMAAEDAAGLAKDPNYVREAFTQDKIQVLMKNIPTSESSVADVGLQPIYQSQPQAAYGQQLQISSMIPDASSHDEAHPFTVVSGSDFGNGDDDLVPRPDASDLEAGDLKKPAAPAQESSTSMFSKFSKQLTKGVDYDIHAVVEEDPMIAAIHANAEKWDPDTEYVFSFLQVFHFGFMCSPPRQ